MRIVSLVPSITLALHQLGVGDRLVGVTDYCVHPQERVAALKKVGGTKNPDLDAIRALEPDLVVANTDEQRAETLERLASGPWDLLVTETDSLEDVAHTWSVLGEATGRKEAARERKAALEEALAAARKKSDRRPPLDVLVPVWKNPWMAAGGGTYLGDLLEACGMHNLLAGEPEKWVLFALTHDPEAARSERPQKGPFKDRRMAHLPGTPHAVLLPSEPYEFKEEDRSAFEPVGVTRERVHRVDGELLTWWLSHTVDALGEFSRLADAVHASLQKTPG